MNALDVSVLASYHLAKVSEVYKLELYLFRLPVAVVGGSVEVVDAQLESFVHGLDANFVCGCLQPAPVNTGALSGCTDGCRRLEGRAGMPDLDLYLVVNAAQWRGTEAQHRHLQPRATERPLG